MRGVVIAVAMVTAVALPVGAQRVAAEIALVESAAPGGAVVLGEVSAEIHQRTMFAKTPARDLADKELRAQAAKLGADAVVDIRYEANSPLLSKKGFRAVGKAVRFAPVQIAAVAPPPASAPGRTATFAPPVEPVPPPAVVQLQPPAASILTPIEPAALPPAPVAVTTPSPTPSIASPVQAAPAAPTPPRVETAAAPPAPVAQSSPVAAAVIPAATRGPTPEALIVLTEQDLAGRSYERLGEVKAEARQMALFPKKSARVLMDEQLRAKAAALGADAVILIRYETYSPLTSKRGANASGVAVKYR